MSEISEVRSGLTPRALAFGFLWVLIATLWQTVFWALSTVPIGNMPGAEQLTGLPTVAIFFSFLTILIGNVLISKMRFTQQEHTVVYAMVLLAGMPVGFYQGWFYLTALFGWRRPANNEVLWWVPSHLIPPKSVVDPALTGGVPVPWNEVSGFMATFILMYLLWGFYGLFSALILRRQLIEVERAPFPYATPAIELIRLTEEDDGKPRIANLGLTSTKIFYFGVFIGFVCYLPWLLNSLMPEIFIVPWSYTWEGGFFFNLDGAPINLWTVLPQVMGCFWLNPELIAFAYLVPIDILLSAGWGWFIFTWVVPIIEDALAITPKAVGWSHCYVPYWYYGMEHGIRHALAFDWGGVLGLGIAMIIINAKYFLSTLKRIAVPESGESERNGMSYRAIWIALAITFVLFFIFLTMWANWHPLMAFFILVYMQIYFFGQTYMKAEAGPQEWYWYWYADDFVSAAVVFGTAKFPLTPGPQSVLYEFALYPFMFGYPSSCAIQCTSLEGFKVAEATRTKPRDLIIAYSITMPIIYILTIIFCVWVAYTFGINRLRVANWGGFGSWAASFYQQPAGYLPDAEKMPFFIWGFVVTLLLMFIRMRFVWFPIHPAGIVVGVGANVKAGPAFWVAWFLKYVTLKVGGTALYERIVPFAVGVGVGAVLLRIIHAALVTGIVMSVGL